MKKRVLAFFVMMLLIATLCTGVSASDSDIIEPETRSGPFMFYLNGQIYTVPPSLIVGWAYYNVGYYVEVLQMALNSTDYNHATGTRPNCYVGNVDGIFREVTYNAVINFQNWINVMENFTNNNANYLTPDGIVGSETWGWLVTYYGG